MVIQVDKDGTGSLDFPEFLMMMAQKVKDNNTTYKIRHIFKNITHDLQNKKSKRDTKNNTERITITQTNSVKDQL